MLKGQIIPHRIHHQYQGFVQCDHFHEAYDLTEYKRFNFSCDSELDLLKGEDMINIRDNAPFGKRMEQLFRHYCIGSKRYSILAENLQIYKGQVTMGELDFILYDQLTDKNIHVELTTKFYLYDPMIEGEHIEKWIGPNRKDSAVKKIKKLKQKQFPLLLSEECGEALLDLDIAQNSIEQQLCFKAFLFVPQSQSKASNHFTSSRVVGTWFRIEEFMEYDQAQFQFFLPEKQDWMVHPSHASVWHTFKEVIELIRINLDKKEATFCWIKNTKQEYFRTFIVWW